MTQAEFATALHFSRDYISQVETGREPSERFKQQIELVERVGVHTLSGADSVGISPGPVEKISAHRNLDGDAYEVAIRRQIEALIAAAADQPRRLAWILEQMDEHLQPPKNWSDSPSLIRRAEEIADQKQRRRESSADESSADKVG